MIPFPVVGSLLLVQLWLYAKDNPKKRPPQCDILCSWKEIARAHD